MLSDGLYMQAVKYYLEKNQRQDTAFILKELELRHQLGWLLTDRY